MADPTATETPEQEQPAQGGAGKLVSDIHSGMMQLIEAAKGNGMDTGGLESALQAFEAAVDELANGGGQPASNQNMPPEAGAADVKPVA